MEDCNKGFIKQIFSDVDDNYSSKRALTAVGMALFVIGFIASVFFKYTIDAALLNVLASIILASIGGTASERFGKKFTETKPTPPTLIETDEKPLASPGMLQK